MKATANEYRDFPAASRAVLEAARAGDFHRVEQLVTAGAELNIADSSGETLLEAIITRLHSGYPGAGIEQVEMVSLLLNLGADPNFLGQSGPLTQPMLAMDVPMLSVMLAAGADPNLPYGSRDDGTLYDWAAYDYVLEIWEYPYESTGNPIRGLDAESLSDKDAWLKRGRSHGGTVWTAHCRHLYTAVKLLNCSFFRNR